MRKEGEIVATIDKDGNVRFQIVNNESEGHGDLLKPFTAAVSDGDKSKIVEHRHDHGPHGHVHVKGGGHH